MRVWEAGDRLCGKLLAAISCGTDSAKMQIPIRTWSEWKGAQPGSVQVDLVMHCGESPEGFFLTTLTVVDVATGWIELEPIWGMGMNRVGAGRARDGPAPADDLTRAALGQRRRVHQPCVLRLVPKARHSLHARPLLQEE